MHIFRHIRLLLILGLSLYSLLFPASLSGKNSFDEKVFLSSREADKLNEKLAAGYRAFIFSEHFPDEISFGQLHAFLTNNPGEIITLIDQGKDSEFVNHVEQSELRRFLAIPGKQSVHKLDECLKQNKRLFLFTAEGSAFSFSSKEYLCNYTVPMRFPGEVSTGFDAFPENGLVVFEVDEALRHLPDSLREQPEIIPEIFNRFTGKLPNFFVTEDKNIFTAYHRKFNQLPWYTAQAEYNGKVLSEVRWKELPDMTSYGRIHTTQAILSPHKDGFHFSPDIFNFNNLTSGTTKIFYARQRDILDEMVLHLDFDRNFDNQAAESKAAPFGNIAYKKDPVRGWCADFNGENHYIDFEKEIVFDENFTLSVWVNPTELSGNRSIIGKGEALSIKIRDRKMLYTSPGIKDHASDSAIVNTHEWQHLTYVIASGETVKFYKNGALIESQKAERIEPTEHSLLVGSNLWDESFKGSMDELIIWNRNLSAEEIKQLHLNGIPGKSVAGTEVDSYLLLAAVVLVFAAIIYFSIRRNKRKKAIGKQQRFVPSKPEPKVMEAPSIQLFGGFQLVNNNNEDLSPRFSPKRKQLFVLVLIKTLTEKGISSKQLTNHLWAGHSAESAKNNRSTQVQRIRETLALNSGVHIAYTDKRWIINMDDTVYCDLDHYFQLLEPIKHDPSVALNVELLDKLLTIIEKGPLLPNMDDEWLDLFKSKISDELLELLLPLFENPDFMEQTDRVIRVSRALLIFDPLNEGLLEHNIRALVKVGKKTLAAESLEHFEKIYLQSYGQTFNKNISEILP